MFFIKFDDLPYSNLSFMSLYFYFNFLFKISLLNDSLFNSLCVTNLMTRGVIPETSQKIKF